jgi:hypothetical protein
MIGVKLIAKFAIECAVMHTKDGARTQEYPGKQEATDRVGWIGAVIRDVQDGEHEPIDDDRRRSSEHRRRW